MRTTGVLLLFCFWQTIHYGQCDGYPCDTLWYDENGDLKDEFVVTGIRFDFAQPNLTIHPEDGSNYYHSTQKMYAKLDSLAGVIRVDGGRFEIQCHDDCRLNPSASIKLCQRRADSVRQYLISAGVVESQLVAKGYGESRPRKISEAGEEILLACDFIQQYQEKGMELYEFYHQLNRRIAVKRLSPG